VKGTAETVVKVAQGDNNESSRKVRDVRVAATEEFERRVSGESFQLKEFTAGGNQPVCNIIYVPP
jgi:hypothetical protein